MRPCILLLSCALSRGSAITTGIFASCTGPRTASIAHCNASLAPDERVAALLGQLSTDEKIALLSPTQTPFCACHTLANDKADLGVYRWLVEANSGVSAPCLSKGRCPTMFIGPLQNLVAESFAPTRGGQPAGSEFCEELAATTAVGRRDGEERPLQ